jgi:prepilin-type N-terminal cleavage/methylation domain-containing protein
MIRMTPRHAGADRPAFSLIEILIAVLVLALGLLGLGAVFPAVIAQQRGALESTQGAAAAESAAAMLRGGKEMANWSVLENDKFFSQDQNMVGGESGGSYRPTSLWETDWPVTNPAQTGPTGARHLNDYRDTGSIYFGSSNSSDPNYPLQRIPEIARLSPPAYSGRDPKYIWDFVARRHPGTKRIEIALFVRNIDSRLRATRDVSVSELIAEDDVFAVAVDGATGRPAPANSANAKYAVPLALGMEIPRDGNEPVLDQITFLNRYPASGDAAFQSGPPDFAARVEMASVVGQKLVDNFGIVRTVTGVVDDLANTVTIDPPFTRQQAAGGFANGPNPGANTVDPVLAQQVVFTPQIPVSIEVFRVE